MPTFPLTVQHAFQGSSGLPKDQAVNDIHMTVTADTIENAAVSAASKTAFLYDELWPVGSGWASKYGSPAYMTLPGHYKVYDRSAPKGTPPILTLEDTVGYAGTSVGVPEQIALCLSYTTGLNIAGHRGRLYLGPFNTQALSPGATGVRPLATMLDAIILSARGMLNPVPFHNFQPVGTYAVVDEKIPGGATSLVWELKHSNKTGGIYTPITQGWIDNEWDGQRRRRIASSARALFGPDA